jgi:hypothetical protein
MDNTEPSYLHYVNQTLVPALGDDAYWTLTNFTIDASGYIDASAVAISSVASRYTPGVIPGHLYKVVIVVAATNEDLVVTMGGVAVATISSSGTYTYYVRPTDGDPLAFTTTGAATTASITSVVVTAQDPFNPELIPVA